MYQMTRKLMTMYKTLQPRDDIDYVSRKEGERGLVSIEEDVDTPIQGIEEYIKKSKEILITAASDINGSIRPNKNNKN